MIKKHIIINVLLSMAVLFSILFQAIHAYEHHSQQLTEKHCQQHYSKNKTELTHEQSIAEKCFTCDFNFSAFTPIAFYVFSFHKNNLVVHSPLYFSHTHSSFFNGSLFSLRAPPAV
jgi:hypothetical protein